MRGAEQNLPTESEMQVCSSMVMLQSWKHAKGKKPTFISSWYASGPEEWGGQGREILSQYCFKKQKVYMVQLLLEINLDTR